MRIPDIPNEILDRLAELDGDVWGDPEPIQRVVPPVEKLTPRMLPAPLRDWVFDIADRMQCPEDYPAVAALVATSSIIGTGCLVLPKAYDNWPVAPNLWGGVIGDPGSLKTPALTAALEPITELERRARRCYDDEMYRHMADELTYKMTRELLTKQLAAAIKGQARPVATTPGNQAGSTQSQVSQLQAQLASLRPPEPPKLTRHKSNDTTVEKLLELLQENGRGLLVFRDELAGMFEQFDREDRVSDRAFYLEGWNGLNPYTSDRITRGTTHADAVCISLLGGIQPGKLEAYLSATMKGYDNDGLMQRLQLMVYPERRPWTLVDRAPDYQAQERAVDLITGLADANFVALGATADGKCRQPYFRFSPRAQRLFNSFLAKLQEKVDGRDHEIIRQHLAKYRSLMPSLALIFHLLDLVDKRRQAQGRSPEPFQEMVRGSPDGSAPAGQLMEPIAAPTPGAPISSRADVDGDQMVPVLGITCAARVLNVVGLRVRGGGGTGDTSPGRRARRRLHGTRRVPKRVGWTDLSRGRGVCHPRARRRWMASTTTAGPGDDWSSAEPGV